ncbi:MAG: tRNA dihydrouridine(20/20a) synthase DusA, partial [Gammaproteobacteria bacterium]|nr:tRNA dihydrouridine(20/20a) synthase DusA [Gammaproteobacteria bacterium]
PSDRVQSGRFGACLMAEPALVAECVQAMRERVSLPVTVKTRVGIDEHDSYAFLRRFVSEVAGAGCGTFIIHARKAWLTGLSPKQNREIPELDYERVYRLKRDHPELEIVINGGITTLQEAQVHRQYVDGVMMGRAAYQNPYLLAFVDEELFGDGRGRPGREQVARAMQSYIERQLADGTRVASVTRHMLGLFAGQPGARRWRRYLSEHAHRANAGAELLDDALEARSAVQQL